MQPLPSPYANYYPDQFDNPLQPLPLQQSPESIKIRLPPVPMAVSRSTRSHTNAAAQRSSPQASGSEYHMSDGNIDMGEGNNVEEPPQPVAKYVTSRGRRIVKMHYQEQSSDPDAEGEPDWEHPQQHNREADDDDDDEQPRYPLRNPSRRSRGNNLKGFIESDGEGEAGVKKRNKPKKPPLATNGRAKKQNPRSGPPRRAKRTARNEEDEDGYVDEASSGTADADISFDNVHTSPEPEDVDADADADGEGELEEPEDDRPYGLRKRQNVNYFQPLPELKEVDPNARPGKKTGGNRASGRGSRFGKKPLAWSANGAELGQWMGLPGDDSDSDNAVRSPRKPLGLGGGVFAGSAGTAGLFHSDLAASGAPSNLGKFGKDTALADIDPLGVNQNVTFDEVGGLEDHVNALKEMTLLPLLYPEVFQRFNVTPPRGVLFHGPPGTGKTLLARALAASARSNGKGISFFMRKGADCLSKWVGEAERQLRLLFEEARNCQPSIIFFDEIDGLAPVRSSKQDQIHASIVSTLLALMDGMDGRGQVVVIGATNRPDAVDPALRRPGRFDREFYFPLPGLDARERILRIFTQKWAGWEGEKGNENAKGLAKLTKGYAGADLRALCTEAALNAVQRRYPQIYKSNDRLLLQPETIDVQLRDFMISVNKLIPSSARSASSTASSLPKQLVPLLSSTLETAKKIVGKVMPVSKKRTALEEAEWEDEGGEDSAFDREMMLQSMERLRIYRPRVVVYGPAGMGQGYLAAAILHHLEGYHVQSLDLGSLMNDSTRTVEAAIVQLFVEAKRHQPSVVYIPSLIGWCAAVTETSRSTVRAMLDSLAPTDPILLLAVVDGSFTSLPRDVRAWFGPVRENRVEVSKPNIQQREEFFEPMLQDILRQPNQFPDGMKRKKRVLEELPIAPPVQPRQLTKAELAVQEDSDQRIITLLKYRLGPILTELKRKFKRFTKNAADEYNLDGDGVNIPPVPAAEPCADPQVETVTHMHVVEIQSGPNGITEVMDQQEMQTESIGQLPLTNGIELQPEIEMAPPPDIPVETIPQPRPHIYEMDLERMHIELYKSKYLTPNDFLNDIRKIAHNATVYAHEDNERAIKAQTLLNAAEVSLLDFDHQFQTDCERMAVRERKRREDRKKARALNRANKPESDAGEAATTGPRRSGRNIGQAPEVAMEDDPVQLERNLKRQRSADGAIDRHSSSEEVGGDGRTFKRSRLSSEDDNDPLDIVGTNNPQLRMNNVRFADEQDSSVNHGRTNIDTPRKSGGFDPALLNPLPSLNPIPSLNNYNHPHYPLDNGNVAPTSTVPIMPIPQRACSPSPFFSDMTSQPVATDRSSPVRIVEPLPPPAQLPGYPQTTEDSSQLQCGSLPIQENLPQAEASQPPLVSEVPVEVQRTPTPLPDFHVDLDQLAQLKEFLCSRTQPLNLEELEQLRATCLGAVWRHRTEWNRDMLIRELSDIAVEFVEEVSADNMSFSP